MINNIIIFFKLLLYRYLNNNQLTEIPEAVLDITNVVNLLVNKFVIII